MTRRGNILESKLLVTILAKVVFQNLKKDGRCGMLRNSRKLVTSMIAPQIDSLNDSLLKVIT